MLDATTPRRCRSRFSRLPGAVLFPLVILLWGLPGSLLADVVELENGQQLEGRVRVLASGDYLITIEEGRTVTISGQDVAKVVSKEAPMDELERRLARIPDDDRDGLVSLATWAEDKGLRRSALGVFRRILKVDPHHEGARNRLGYVVYKNRWVPRKSLEGKGLVRFRGVWRTPQDIERIRQEEAVKEFRALLQDVHSDNQYLRQNARLRLLEEKNPRLIPFLSKLLDAKDPLERMLASAVLGNHTFGQVGKTLYSALCQESRDEVRTAQAATLQKFRNPIVAEWAARDLRTAEGNALRGLLVLLEACPHRVAVPALIDLVDRPGWGRVADRVLAKTLRVSSRGKADWQRFWSAEGRRYPVDLGSGWLRP